MADLIIVDRINLEADATRSMVYVGGKPLFKMLEDVVRPAGVKVKDKTAIPEGRYLLGLRDSPKFSKDYYTSDNVNLIERKVWEGLSAVKRALYRPHETIWVMNVPNFQYILHHWGNTQFDTDGCGIIGTSFGKLGVNTAVLASRAAYVKYYALVAQAIRKGGQYVTYQNSFPVPV